MSQEYRCCKECSQNFPLTEEFFSQYKKGGYGKDRGTLYFRHICKECARKISKIKHAANKEYRNLYSRKYHAIHKEDISERKKNYYQIISKDPKVIEKRKAKDRKRYWSNPEKFRIENRIRNKKPSCKARTNYLRKEKYKSDLNYKISHRLRTRLRQMIVVKNAAKIKSALGLLGCRIDQFKRWIEMNFEPGMTWDNFGNKDGQWSYDHYIPCNSFDLEDPNQQEICFRWDNIFPMWHIDNIKKKNSIPGPLSPERQAKKLLFEEILKTSP